MSFLFPKKYVASLDIGSKFIKTALFEYKGREPVMVQFEMIPTPEGSVDKGIITDSDVLQEALRELIFSKLKFKSKYKMNLSLGGQIISSKRIDIPKSEEKLMHEHVYWEASQYLPYDMEDASYDYIEIPFSSDSGMQSIFFVASNKKLINAYNMCLRDISVDLNVIDTAFFALQRTLIASKPNPPFKADENVLILDIGNQTTGFTIVRGSHVIFFRDLFIGMCAFVEELQISMGINKNEAENLIISAGNEEEVPEDVMKAIESRFHFFSNEISMGNEYFTNHFPNESISKCYVTGGAMCIPKLISHLSKSLDIKMAPFQVLRGIKTKGFSKQQLKEIQPFVGACVGLVLR